MFSSSLVRYSSQWLVCLLLEAKTMDSLRSAKSENAMPCAWRDTLFADLLQSVHLRSSIYSRAELRSPWGFKVNREGIPFHIVAQGSCWLELPGIIAPVELSAGDFVIMPRGGLHIVRDSQASPVVDLVKCDVPDSREVFRAGGNGPMTKLVCGGMNFENSATDPLLVVLPALIHVKGEDGGRATWLQATVTQIVTELDSGGAGAQAVVTRLADILFIHAVRTYLEQNSETAECGWLAAIRDPHIGPALAVLHANPQEPWTVASLARRAALSRSLFAAKFAELVGVSPLQYVKRLRLNAAAARLRTTDDKLGAIAADVGYESAVGFTKAFKKHLGKTPGEYRHGR
jgi:AraC-like DNA-binding protein